MAAGAADEQGEDTESRSPVDVTAVAGRATAEFVKVEYPWAMLLKESPSKGDPKMPLTGIWGTREWEAGRLKNPMSRSRILLAVFRDIPLKRKKSTGGLFLGVDQFIIALLHLATGFVTVEAVLVVLGTEWIFFGLPTGKEKVTERSYAQNELTSLQGRMRLFRERSTSGKLNISAILSSQVS